MMITFETHRMANPLCIYVGQNITVAVCFAVEIYFYGSLYISIVIVVSFDHLHLFLKHKLRCKVVGSSSWPGQLVVYAVQLPFYFFFLL